MPHVFIRFFSHEGNTFDRQQEKTFASHSHLLSTNIQNTEPLHWLLFSHLEQERLWKLNKARMTPTVCDPGKSWLVGLFVFGLQFLEIRVRFPPEEFMFQQTLVWVNLLLHLFWKPKTFTWKYELMILIIKIN